MARPASGGCRIAGCLCLWPKGPPASRQGAAGYRPRGYHPRPLWHDVRPDTPMATPSRPTAGCTCQPINRRTGPDTTESAASHATHPPTHLALRVEHNEGTTRVQRLGQCIFELVGRAWTRSMRHSAVSGRGRGRSSSKQSCWGTQTNKAAWLAPALAQGPPSRPGGSNSARGAKLSYTTRPPLTTAGEPGRSLQHKHMPRAQPRHTAGPGHRPLHT